jgi:polysaccharide biosynthesis/export protein
MSARLIASLVGVTVVLAGCASHEAHAPAHPGWTTVIDERTHGGHAPAAHPGWHPTVAPAGMPESYVIETRVAAEENPNRYTLDTGDRLRIFVYGQPNLSRLYTVDHAGKVAIPLIGNVQARGKTVDQLSRIIRGKLGAEYVRDPQVTVDVQENRPFFILGEVRNAGQFPYVNGMTVQTAVAIAGGFSERADEKKARITRRMSGFAEQFDVPMDYILKPGDTVYVRERFF